PQLFAEPRLFAAARWRGNPLQLLLQPGANFLMRIRPPFRHRITYGAACVWSFVVYLAGCPTQENCGSPILAAASSRPGWDRRLSLRASFLKSFLVATLLCCLAAVGRIPALSQAPQPASPVVLDSVVAVVN